MSQTVVVARKRQGEWRGAVIVDNVFQDAFTAPDLYALLQLIPIAPFERQSAPEGTQVSINVTITPDAEK